LVIPAVGVLPCRNARFRPFCWLRALIIVVDPAVADDPGSWGGSGAYFGMTSMG
jgi:hypothetical protein